MVSLNLNPQNTSPVDKIRNLISDAMD